MTFKLSTKSTAQFVDLTSSRNVFIIGVSIYFGVVVPMWTSKIVNDPEAAVSLTGISWFEYSILL